MLEDKDLEQIKQMIAETIKGVLTTVPVKKPKKSRKKVDKKVSTVKILEDVPQPEPAQVQRSSRPRTRLVSGGKVNGKQQNKRMCRIEPINTDSPRPNNFVKSDMMNQFKSDTLIDKKLSGGNTPVPRREEVQMAEVDCIICGSIHIVPLGIIPIDYDTNEARYTCDSCIRSR